MRTTNTKLPMLRMPKAPKLLTTSRYALRRNNAAVSATTPPVCRWNGGPVVPDTNEPWQTANAEEGHPITGAEDPWALMRTISRKRSLGRER